MSDDVADITNRILIDIRNELRGHSAELAGLNERVDGLNHRLDGVNQRIDGLLDVAGAGRQDHEGRLARLETRVDRLEKPRGRR